MFLRRNMRPARYGRWIDQVPPVEMTEDQRRYALSDALGDIARTAPLKLGNRVEDWSDDEDEEA